MKAREERYFAGQKEAGGEEGGEEGEEQEEGEEEGEGALTTTTTTSTKKSKTAAAAPLSMEFLETVQQAKAADQQRRIHEALQVINLARCGRCV